MGRFEFLRIAPQEIGLASLNRREGPDLDHQDPGVRHRYWRAVRDEAAVGASLYLQSQRRRLCAPLAGRESEYAVKRACGQHRSGYGDEPNPTDSIPAGHGKADRHRVGDKYQADHQTDNAVDRTDILVHV